jgi:hypothetical protein
VDPNCNFLKKFNTIGLGIIRKSPCIIPAITWLEVNHYRSDIFTNLARHVSDMTDNPLEYGALL